MAGKINSYHKISVKIDSSSSDREKIEKKIAKINILL